MAKRKTSKPATSNGHEQTYLSESQIDALFGPLPKLDDARSQNEVDERREKWKREQEAKGVKFGPPVISGDDLARRIASSNPELLRMRDEIWKRSGGRESPNTLERARLLAGLSAEARADFDKLHWRDREQRLIDLWGEASLSAKDRSDTTHSEVHNKEADGGAQTSTSAYDPDAYMPVKELREQEPPWTCADWTKIKAGNPWLRFDPHAPKYKPRIHRADAAKLRRGKLKPNTFELLDVQGNDLPSVADDEITEDFLADAAARKAEIRAQKKHEKSA